MTITVEQAKTQLEAMIARSTAGEDVVITRDGHPVARMIAVAVGVGVGGNGTVANGSVAAEEPPQRLGWGKDIVTYIAPDFDEPVEDFREYME